ncbi:MAG: GNAT family N-acetyltransferase [Acidimicrobiales bacterium]
MDQSASGYFRRSEPGFQDALTRNFQRGSALLAETDSGDAVGGMLFSLRTAPTYRIGWLVVDGQSRSRGLGQTLVAEGLRRWFEPPGVLEVVTFGPDHPGARSRSFYERPRLTAGGDDNPGA